MSAKELQGSVEPAPEKMPPEPEGFIGLLWSGNKWRVAAWHVEPTAEAAAAFVGRTECKRVVRLAPAGKGKMPKNLAALMKTATDYEERSCEGHPDCNIQWLHDLLAAVRKEYA
jgi:hypothetical protein